MGKNKNIEAHELDFIQVREKYVKDVLTMIQSVAKFKEGDYLVAYFLNWDEKRELVKNSYGTAKKFIVVHNDCNNIPYMKELNKNGVPFGPLICPISLSKDGNGAIRELDEYEFEVDPDFADALIMEDEKNFDASTIHKIKSDLFKEITEHNKKLKISFSYDEQKELLNFLKTLKVGDIFYKSTKTYFTITSLTSIPTTHRGQRLVEYQRFGEAITSNGKRMHLNHLTFRNKAIYTSIPRSYNELKDLK